MRRPASARPTRPRRSPAPPRWPGRRRPVRLRGVPQELHQPTPRSHAAPVGTAYLVAAISPAVDGGAPDGEARTALGRTLDVVAAAHGGHRWTLADEPHEAVALPSAVAAVAVAVAVRRSWRRERPGWPSPRLAVHTGPARIDGPRHAGPGVRQTLRLLEIAHDGQALVSASAAAAAGDRLPAGSRLHDLGIHRLRDLGRGARVLELRDDGDRLDVPPPASLDASPNNLPSQATSFVGRATELCELHERLVGARLLTLTGPGGSGKTRLAAQLAADQVGRWPDGVWWVELGGLVEPRLVPAEVAAALGLLVDPGQGATASLRTQLADRRLLLCLDNCEHLLEAVAELAGGLAECPEVTIVATGREPLGLAEETVWRLPPLRPEEARELFLERAVQVQPDLVLDDDAEAAIPSMCTRLDGSPLALELAAAWLRTLTPRQIESGLDDRFALLVRSPRDAVPRHASLLASVTWSYELLDEHDRAVFRRLAVFVDGFDLPAARAVCADGGVEAAAVLGAIARLVDKSLVTAGETEPGGTLRYRLAETIRQYAADRLRAAGERPATADRHLAQRLAQVEALAPELDRDKDRWRIVLAVEHDNLRAAIDHGLAAEDPSAGRRLAAALPWLWHLHRQGREGMQVLRRAIDRAPDERSALQARLLVGLALVADTADPLDVELDAAERALALAVETGDQRLRALCLVLAAVARLYTDLDGAGATALEAEAIAATAGEPFVADAGQALRGIVLHLRDEHERADALLAPAGERLIARGDRGVGSTALAFRSGGARLTGDLAEARALAERAVAVATPLADHLRIGIARSALALALGSGGELEAGLAALGPIVRLIPDGDATPFVPEVGRALGLLRLWAGDPASALRWLSAEAASSDGGRPTFLAVRALPALAAAQRELGELAQATATAERAVALARERRMPAVLADALDEQARSLAAREPETAVERRHEALSLRVEHGLLAGTPASLEGLAALYAATPEHAVRLLAAAAAARTAQASPVPPVDRPALVALTSTLREQLGDEADAIWRAGSALSLDEAVAYARRSRGRRRRPEHGWGSLTPAELEVVRLAVEGLSNPQIGARLFMSRSTVKTHLSHVYAKLDVANRTELAALAAAHLEG